MKVSQINGLRENSTNPNLTVIQTKRIRYKIRYKFISTNIFKIKVQRLSRKGVHCKLLTVEMRPQNGGRYSLNFYGDIEMQVMLLARINALVEGIVKVN